MKRTKSKVFKRHKDLIRAAVAGINERQIDNMVYLMKEREKDKQFIQENRLRFEMDRGGPIE